MIITEKTFAQVYGDYFEVLCRFLNYYTHDSHCIEEVVQDLFVKLWMEHKGRSY